MFENKYLYFSEKLLLSNSVFNLYYHKDITDTIEGTGIGLALCKKLMDLHNAEILVKSEIGIGSEFTIELFNDDKNEDYSFGMPGIFAMAC